MSQPARNTADCGRLRPRHLPIFLAALATMIAGCASQSSNHVLVRQPGNRLYDPPQEVKTEAQRLVSLAVLSANVYYTDWGTEKSKTKHPSKQSGWNGSDAAIIACETADQPIPLPGWKRWDHFPSQPLRLLADKYGLYFEVWENTTADQPIIAFVFRGTEFESWLDWQANLRWLVKWIPGWKDQYWVVRNDVRIAFRKALDEWRSESGGSAAKFSIVTAGHSLGGGLAQQLAYSLLEESDPPEKQKVSEAFAFDSSPVTGWYSVPEADRERNANGLLIHRAFEHGEILAYVRLLLSYVYPPPSRDPAVTEIRFNFNKSWNPFSEHGIRGLACHLQHFAGK